jgi:hypothetical protein
MSLLLSGRKWWDYISYNPNLPVPLIVHRIYPDPAAFEKIVSGIMTGKRRIKEIQQILTSII